MTGLWFQVNKKYTLYPCSDGQSCPDDNYLLVPHCDSLLCDSQTFTLLLSISLLSVSTS